MLQSSRGRTEGIGERTLALDADLDRGPRRARLTTRVNRRELLLAGTVAAGSLYLGIDRRRSARGRARRGRVIVVGAGLAGLSAAWELERRGWEAEVLEARSRIGGRCHTLRGFAGGQVAEAGGEFIDSTHRRMLAFARRFDLPLEDVRRGGEGLEGIAYVGGRRIPYERFADRETGRQIDRFYRSAWRLGRNLDPGDPSAAGARHDRRSAAEFIDGLGIVGRPREVLDRELRDDFAIEPERLSLLFMLIENKVTWNTPEAGVEAFRIAGGNDRMAAAFARRLHRAPRLGARVTAVRRTARGVTVTAGGEAFEGDHVVLAAALPGLRGVRFDPALPEAVAAAVRELQYGPITKTPIQYASRAWRRQGYSGDVFSDLPFSTSWEATDRQRGRAGILLTYASGDAGLAAARVPKSARIGAIGRELDRVFPGSAPLAGHATSIAWSNSPLDGGAYSAFAPGQMNDFWAALRRPYERLQLAGEHTATQCGYMEGALESGLRAARRIDAGA